MSDDFFKMCDDLLKIIRHIAWWSEFFFIMNTAVLQWNLLVIFCCFPEEQNRVTEEKKKVEMMSAFLELDTDGDKQYVIWQRETWTKSLPFGRDISKCVFLNEYVCILIQISVRFVCNSPGVVVQYKDAILPE